MWAADREGVVPGERAGVGCGLERLTTLASFPIRLDYKVGFAPRKQASSLTRKRVSALATGLVRRPRITEVIPGHGFHRIATPSPIYGNQRWHIDHKTTG